MNRRTFVALSVGAPFLSCIVVPTLLFGVLIGQWGTNLIWGPVFGFGWWVAQTVGGPEHFRAAGTIGFLVWPPIVLWGLAAVARSVCAAKTRVSAGSSCGCSRRRASR